MASLRRMVLPQTALHSPIPVPGLRLDHDRQGQISGTWRSPAGRVIEIDSQIVTPCDWFALRMILPPLDLGGAGWLGYVTRSTAGRTMVVQACLRSGLANGGTQDLFFPRHILSGPAQSDHHDLISPAQYPDLPQTAAWREFILFLPATQTIAWALHDLRLFVL